MLEAVKEVEIPQLTPEELEEYLDLSEKVAGGSLVVDEAKAMLALQLSNYNQRRFDRQKFLKNLSQKYQVAFYDDSYEADILTGKITKREKP